MDVKAALLTNATATGAAVTLLSGGQYVFDAAGTFNGATVKLQRLASDAATWIDVATETTLTAAGHALVTLSAGSYRAFVSGGPPAAMYAALRSAF